MLLLLNVTTVSATTYYWSGVTPVTDVTKWSTNVSGFGGTQPANFSGASDVFWIVNSNSSITLAANISLGSGGVLHIGSGNSATINGSFWNPTIVTAAAGNVTGSGTVIVENGATLQLGTATVPTFAATQGATSNVIFTTATTTIPSGISFGNVTASGTTQCSSGNTTIQGNLSISSALFTLATTTTLTKLYVNGDVTISGTGALRMANLPSAIDTLFVGGNLSCSGTASSAGTSATSQTMINFQSGTSGAPATSVLMVNGDVSNTGTACNFLDWGAVSSSTATTNSALICKRNLTMGGASRFYYTGNGLGGYVRFMGSGNQTFAHTSTYPTGATPNSGSGIQYANFIVHTGAVVTLSGTLPLGNASSQFSSFIVQTGATLDLGSTGVITGGGSTASTAGVSVASGATLITANTGGILAGISASLNTATGLSTGANYVFNGSATQITSSRLPITVNKLTLTNSSGVTLSQSTTTGTLEFTAGKLLVGSNTITVSSSVTGAGASSYVNTASGGKLTKPVSGLTNMTFEVGDNTYAPVNLTLSSAGTSGSLSVQAKAGQHPNYATSNLSGGDYANHYWTFTSNSVAGPASITPRFNYDNSGDIIGGDNSAFIIKQYAASTWSAALAATNSASPAYTQVNSGIALASIAADYVAAKIPPVRYTYYSKSTGALNDLTTWGLNTDGTGTAPANFTNSGDSFIVKNNATPTLTANWSTGFVRIMVGDGVSATNFTVPAAYTLTNTGSINVAANGTLTFVNSSIPSLNSLATNSTVVFNTASPITIPAKTYYNLTFSGSSTSHATGATVINGAYNITSGAVTLSSAATLTGTVNVSGTATLNIGSTPLPTLGTLSSGSTINFNTASAITIPINSYGNLSYSGSSTAQHTAGTTAIAGNYTISSGTVTIAPTAATYNVTIGGDMILNGTGALVMAASTGVTCAPTVTITGNLTCTSTASTEILWHSASGTPPNAVMQVNGNVSDNNTGAADAVFIDWGNATSVGSSSYLGVKGNVSLAGRNSTYVTGNYSAKGFVFNGAGTSATPQTLYWNQTSSAAVSGGYCNYTINSGTYVKLTSNVRMGTTASSTYQWQNIFRVLSGGSLDCAVYTVSDGNSTNGNGFQLDAGATLISANTGGILAGISASLTTATGLSTGANYVFNGTTAQITSTRLPVTVNKLTINNNSGVTLSQGTTTGTLEFTTGKLLAGGNTITVSSSVTGAGTSSYVNTNASGSKLAKSVSGLTTLVYEVGDSTYAPVNITLNSAGTSGSLAVQSRTGQHPSFATSGLSGGEMANHYWTLTNNAVAGPSTITPRFNYNFAGDIIGGDNSAFIAKQYIASAWGGVLAVTNSASPAYTQLNSGIAPASIAADYVVAKVAPVRYTYYSKSTGALNDTSTWGLNSDGTGASPSNFTNSGDSFIVRNNPVPTLTANWSTGFVRVVVGDGINVTNFTVPAAYTFTNSGSVNVAAYGTITFVNSSIPALNNLANNSTVIFNTVSPITIPAKTYYNLSFSGSSASHASGATVINGAFNITAGTVTLSSAATLTGTVNVSGTATFNIGSTPLPTLGTLSAGSTINFSTSSAITIPINSYGNLIYSGSSTAKHTAGSTTVAGNYTVSSGTVTIAPTAAAYTVNITGDMILNGTGALVMAGVAGTACAPTVNISGNLTCNSTASTEILWHSVSGTPPTAVMQVNGNVSDNNTGSADANFIDWGSATAVGPNSYLGIKGNLSLAGRNRIYLVGDYSPKGIVFNGTGTSAAPQTLYWNQTHASAVSNGYCNYTINSGTYVKLTSNVRMGTNASSTFQWQNIFRVLSGGTLDCAVYTVSDGNSTNGNGFQVDAGATLITANTGGILAGISASLTTATGLSTGANYVFNGAAAQITSTRLPATVNKLTINNAAGTTLSQNTTAGTLEFTAGKLYTSTFKITNTSSITGVSSTSYVYANAAGGGLLKPINGLSTVTFEVGDSSYAPVTLTLNSSGTSGFLGARSEYSIHPAFVSSGISAIQYANHYWSLINSSAAGPSTVTPKFTYNIANIIGTSNGAFVAHAYNGSAWSATGGITNNASPAYSTITSPLALAAIQADYQIGDSALPRFTYYAKSSGFLNLPSSWGTNTDGTGSNPTNFGNTGDSFVVVNNAAPTLNSAWNLTGVTLVLGNGATNVSMVVPATSPMTTSGTFVVMPGSSITINADAFPAPTYMGSSSTLRYNGSGNITLPAINYGSIYYYGTGTATMAAGTAIVNGAFNLYSGTLVIPSTTTVNSGSGINIPGNATLNLGINTLSVVGTVSDSSTIILSGSGAYSIPARTFGNLTFAGSGTGAHSVGTTNINGTYTISSGIVTVASTPDNYKINVGRNFNISGTGATVLASIANVICKDTITVAGDMNVSTTATAAGSVGGSNTAVNFQSASGVASLSVIQVNGNFTSTSTASNLLDWGAINSSSYTSLSYLGVKGNFTFGGASRMYYLGTGLGGYIKFNGTSPQTLTYSSTYPYGTVGGAGSGIQYCNFIISSGARVSISGNLPLGTGGSQPSLFTVANGGILDLGTNGVISAGTAAGGFQVLSGGTIMTANPGGISAGISATLNSTTGYATGANYTFYGNTATPFPSNITTNPPGTVTINSSYVKSNYAIAPSVSLAVNTADTFDMASNQLTGAFTPSLSGVLRTANNAASPIPAGLGWGGTVEYYLATGGQNIVGGTYTNLVNNNSSNQNSIVSGATITINGDLVLTPSSTLSDNGVTINLAGNLLSSGRHISSGPGKIRMTGIGKKIQSLRVGNIMIDGSGNFWLDGNPLVAGILTLSSGTLSLYGNSLTLETSSTFSGSYSNLSMIIADSTGKILRKVSNPGSYLFPVGDRLGTYTPETIIISSGSFSASSLLSVNLGRTKPSANANTTNYIKRYWNDLLSGITGATYTVNATYNSTDVVGAEYLISSAKFAGSLPWTRYGSVNTVTHNITTGSFSDTGVLVTGISSVNPIVTVIPSANAICSGSGLSLAAAPVADMPIAYSWAAPIALSSSSDSLIVEYPSLTGNLIYTLTATDGNGFIAVDTAAINVLNQPSVVTTTISSLCLPDSVGIMPGTFPVGSPVTYSITWNASALAAGFTNISAAPYAAAILWHAPPSVTGSFTGTYRVSNIACSSFPQSFSANLYPHANAYVSSVNVPCLGYIGNIDLNGAANTNVTYSVDGGSIDTLTLTGSTYSLSTGVITSPHSYIFHNASNPACAEAINDTVIVSPITMSWTGGTIGHVADWNTPSNWSCGFVPTINDSVVISNSTAYLPELPGGFSATVKDLFINSGTILSLNSNADLLVSGNLHNSGTINGTGKLTLAGGPTQIIDGIGTINNLVLNNPYGASIMPDSRVMVGSTLKITSGTFITNDSLELLSIDSLSARIDALPATGAAINGKVKVNQYVQGGYRRYRFWGHCFSDTISLSQLSPYIDITGSGGATNGFTNTASNNPSAFRYDPNLGNDSLGYDPGWRPFTKINTSAADSNKLHPGQGIRLFFRGAKGEGLGWLGYYGMYTPSPVINSMRGHVNQGPVRIYLDQGHSDPLHQSYNQISNPYPSPIDIGTVLYNAKAAGQITGAAFYIWDPAIGAGGQYLAIPIGVGSAVSYYIQANTSYQVKAAYDNAYVDFAETNKVPTSSHNLFRAAENAFRVNIYDTSYHLWDALTIQFNNRASDAEDKQLDATKPSGPDFNFYSLSANGSKLAIDARPYENNKVIPLGVISSYKQDYVLRAESISLPAGGAVTLHDKLLSKYIDLKEGTEYRFTIDKDKATQGNDRFELSLKPLTKADSIEFKLSPNPVKEEVKIKFTSGSNKSAIVRIMDFSGVTIYNQILTAPQNTEVFIPMSNFASGVYIVEIVQGDQKTSKKLIKQ